MILEQPICYVNLPGGYTWITVDGVEPSAELRKILEPSFNEAFQTHRRVEVQASIASEQRIKAVAVFDDSGKDEIGRPGLVFLLGSIGSSDREIGYPQDDTVRQLLQKRVMITAAGATPEIAKLAFLGAIYRYGLRDPQHEVTELDVSPIPNPAGLLVKKRSLHVNISTAVIVIFAGLALLVSAITAYRLEMHLRDHAAVGLHLMKLTTPQPVTAATQRGRADRH